MFVIFLCLFSASLTRVARVFRETLTGGTNYDLLLMSLSDVGDASKRLSKKPNVTGLPVASGYLWKKGKSGAFGTSPKWKKKYFLLQDVTLFWFESESHFRKGEPAQGHVPMGSCPIYTIEEKYKDWNFAFEINTDCIKTQSHKIQLIAESAPEMNMWIHAVQTLNFRRIKSIAVNILEELSRRGLTAEGLFRVSGSQEQVTKIKSSYDHGMPPNLNEIRDDNALSSVVKLVIRELPDPILTHKLYKVNKKIQYICT
jgi:hypothetical protein